MNWVRRQLDGPGGIAVLLSISVPMIISNAAETLMMFVDRMFLSRLGREHLAAAMSGGLTTFMFMTFFLGVIGYVNALSAQYYGAGRKTQCSVASAQGMLLALASYPLVLATLPLGRYLLSLAGHAPLQNELETTYFSILIFGSVMGLLRSALSGFFCGIGRTRMVMVANGVAMVVNIIGNYILIFGHFGSPALGIRGAAYGTLLGSATGLAVLAAAYLAPAVRREFATGSSFALVPAVMRRLLRFGTPGGVEFFLNLAAFNVFVQLFHSYGTDAAAAITITFNWDLLAFLPLLGFNMGITSLVGRHLGAGEPDVAERAAYSGLKAAGIYGLIMGLVFLLFPRQLAGMFAAGAMAEEYARVLPLAITTLRLAALYTLADAVLVVFDGALRGAGDVKWTMTVSVTLHWLMAASCLVGIRWLKITPVTAWWMFILLVLTLATALALRFLGGKWRTIKVIEPYPAPLAAGTAPPDTI